MPRTYFEEGGGEAGGGRERDLGRKLDEGVPDSHEQLDQLCWRQFVHDFGNLLSHTHTHIRTQRANALTHTCTPHAFHRASLLGHAPTLLHDSKSRVNGNATLTVTSSFARGFTKAMRKLSKKLMISLNFCVWRTCYPAPHALS